MMQQNQHCDGCGFGPTFEIQLKRGQRCVQNIERSLWDGVENTCPYFQYVPGTDLEVDSHGSLIDQ